MKMPRCLLPLLLFAVLGCSSTSRLPRSTSAVALPPPVVTLEPGDVIEIKFRYCPELDQTQSIRPDGKVALELVNEVQAAGLTPDELRRHLLELYAGTLKEPVITVIVREMVNQKVFVGGEVLAPGMIPLVGRMTVLEAIMAAGGYNKHSAQMRNVVVVRRIGDQNHAMAMDLRQALERPTSEVFYLAPHDIVFIPRTRIDNVDQWVEQYINRVIPQTALNFNYQGARTNYGYGLR